MANGRINFGKQSGGVLGLLFPDGVTNTEVTLPESGELATTSDINTAAVALKTIATGTATFTATTNNINLTGIGVGVEIGDVIQISGAEDAKNNSEFTVEVITDANNIIVNQAHANNIIVNQAHANKGTTKNVAAQAGDAGVTVKLLAKWYNASEGLGQGWVNLTSSRAISTTYSNNTKRTIQSAILGASTAPYNITLTIGGVAISQAGFSGHTITGATFTIPKESSYTLSEITSISQWIELR